MARLTRKNIKVFAGDATNNGVFGSLQANNPTLSNDVEQIQSLTAWSEGWNYATETSEALPPLEEFQGVQYVTTYQQAYLMQEGIPEWASTVTYYKGCLAKEVTANGFRIYNSLTDNNNNHLLSDTSNWKKVMDSDDLYAFDNNVVHKTGNEDIGGVKSFTSDMYIYNNNPFLYLKQPSLIKGDTPSSTITAFVSFIDDSGTLSGAHQFSSIGCQVSAETGLVTSFMNVYKNVEGSSDYARIAVYYPTSGNPYTSCPDPTVTTSTTSPQIATVGWVNRSENNVVHKTGSETISGTKTFQGTGWNLYIKNTNVTYNTAPSSDTTTTIAFVDKNSQNMGTIDCFRLTDNSTMMQFNIYGRKGSWATRPLEFKILSNGKEAAFAPASDVIDSIVTTTAIHKATGKGSFKFGNGMIVNYGAQQMTKDSTTVITFDTPFTGDYTYGLSTGYKSSISRDDPITIPNRTSTNFTARNTARDSDAVTCIWVAIGY